MNRKDFLQLCEMLSADKTKVIMNQKTHKFIHYIQLPLEKINELPDYIKDDNIFRIKIEYDETYPDNVVKLHPLVKHPVGDGIEFNIV